ncbi:MAG: hypothetical protein K8S87_08070 [Planctomycetes bacterium]|nr:hypothetical protein [Planctomycetota bacterium]
MRRFLAIIVIVSLFSIPAFTGDKEKADEGNAPKCLKGFAGMLYGKLIKKLDNGFLFEVKEVLKTWKHNKCDDYAESVGKQIRVYFRKVKTKKGTFVLDEMLVAYIRKLEMGAKFEIDVRYDGNKIFFLELTGDQREFVKKGTKKKDEPKEMKPVIPDGMHGFSGRLKGKVVGKQKNGFILLVEKVEKLWEGNKAKKPETVIGKKVLINVGWEEYEKSKWRPIPLHARFVEMLKIGNKISIEVKNIEGERLHILELNKEQRALAEKKEDKKEEKPEKDWKKEYEIPEGMIGFSGVLEGFVVKKLDNGFVLKATGVPTVWKDSKAKNTASVIGKKVIIFTGWAKNDKGKWHPVEAHLKFIKKLKLEQKIKIEVKNFEGRHLSILELGD